MPLGPVLTRDLGKYGEGGRNQLRQDRAAGELVINCSVLDRLATEGHAYTGGRVATVGEHTG